MFRKSPRKKRCKKSQTIDLQSKRCRKKKSTGRKSLKRYAISKVYKPKRKSRGNSMRKSPRRRKSRGNSMRKSPRRRRTSAAASDEHLDPGTIVTLIKPNLNWEKVPETITAYYIGVHSKDNELFYRIKEEDDMYEPGETYDPMFHIKHDGDYKIETEKSCSIEEILLKNKYKLNCFPPAFDFSSDVGMLRRGEIGVFTGIIMCVGVAMHNIHTGDILAFHYVAPHAENQDNRQKAFKTIKDAMKFFKWNIDHCKLNLFLKINETTQEALDAALVISNNFAGYESYIHVLDNRIIRFKHDEST